MTAEEMLLTLRICWGHPSVSHLTCKECPHNIECHQDDLDKTPIELLAADVIEELMKELAAARVGIY